MTHFRQETVEAGLKNPKFSHRSKPEFTGDPVMVCRKKYDLSKLKEFLNWKPRHSSIDSFMTTSYQQEVDCKLLTFKY